MAQTRSQSVSSSGSGSSYSSYYSSSGGAEMQELAAPPGQLATLAPPAGPTEPTRSQDEMDECDGRTALGFEVRDLLKVSSDRQVAIDESALLVGKTRRLAKETREDLLQVTGETIHNVVWVQLWLASFKARKSWHSLQRDLRAS
eukprot:6461976-Amphidinium_carterae.2